MGLRFTEAPALPCEDASALRSMLDAEPESEEHLEECMEAPGLGAVLHMLQQPCGIHSDKCDADVYEIITYVHSRGSVAAPELAARSEGAALAMALHLRGGAITRQHNKKKSAR